MNIVAMVPFFREDPELVKACFLNVAFYADAAVVCVNDHYDRETEDFLRSFPVVKQVAFVNKDTFSDAIFNSSLLTMAQSLRPDWLVKQDIDEEFEPKFAQIRDFLSRTDLDWISCLWPSYVQDKEHHCYFHHQVEAGTVKHVIFRFDLTRLYVPAGQLTNLEMKDAKRGTINVRLFHNNLLKSDQQNHTKFVKSGRESVHDLCVANLRKERPEVLLSGQDNQRVTFQKRDRDAAAFLPFCFRSTSVPSHILFKSSSGFDRSVLSAFLTEWYTGQDVAAKLAQEQPKVPKKSRFVKTLVRAAIKTGLNKRLYTAIQRVRASLS